MSDEVRDKGRRIILMPIGVCNAWDPLVWFKSLKKEIPRARILGFAPPTRIETKFVEAWKKEQRAKLGLFGWRGSTYEAFGWTVEEAYLKLRSGRESAPFDPFVWFPDGAFSGDALEATAILKLNVVMPGNQACAIPVKGVPTLPYTLERSDERWPFAVLFGRESNLEKLRESLISLNKASEIEWADPPFATWITEGQPVVEEASAQEVAQ